MLYRIKLVIKRNIPRFKASDTFYNLHYIVKYSIEIQLFMADSTLTSVYKIYMSTITCFTK